MKYLAAALFGFVCALVFLGTQQRSALLSPAVAATPFIEDVRQFEQHADTSNMLADFYQGGFKFDANGNLEVTTVGGIASTVSINGPVDGSGYVNIHCQTGCGTGSFAINSPLDGSGFVNIDCKTGCANGTFPSPIPLPTASAGTAPTAAPPDVAQMACFVPAGAAPSVTGGNMIAAQCDSSGNLKVTGTSGAPLSQATSTPVSTTQGVGIQGVFNGNDVPIAVDPSGRININCAANCNPPFTGGANGITPAAGQSVGIDGYSVGANAMEAIKTNNGFLLPPDPCAQGGQSEFNSSGVTASGDTELVAGVSSQVVYLCSMQVFSNVGAIVVTFDTGTKTTNPCDTSNAQRLGKIDVATQFAFVMGNGGATMMKSISSGELCLKLSAAVSGDGVTVHGTYVQQ